MQTGGLDYQKIVRLENPCWDASLWEGQAVNPVQLQMQWAVQYDKDDFIGKDAVTELSQEYTGNKLIGMIAQEECEGIEAGDRVLVEGQDVGYVVKALFSPALQRFIALTLLERITPGLTSAATKFKLLTELFRRNQNVCRLFIT